MQILLFAIVLFGWNVAVVEYAPDVGPPSYLVCADDGQHGNCIDLQSMESTGGYDCGPTGCDGW